MNNLKYLSILYLIIYGYSSSYTHSNFHANSTHAQLLSTIHNTKNPSPRLVESWLKTAFESNYQDIIKHILRHIYFNRNYQDKFGNTWLHYAAALGNPEIVKILLQKDICRNTKNIFGNTALHDNVRYNPNLKIIKQLFFAGIKPGIENNDGQTALDLYLQHNPNPNRSIINMLKKHCMCFFLP